MDPDTPRPHQEDPPNQGPGATDPTVPSDSASAPREPFRDFTESIRDAFETGGRDARRAFEDALPKVKDDLAKGVHDLAYALAFAGAFGGALIREVTPANLKEGLREGASAGERAAGEILRQRKEKAEREARGGFSTEEGQATV